MQEEIKKHSKKIFSITSNPHSSISKKIREVLLEIVIIFIAVSISVWFHNYNEERHQQHEVTEFLNDIKDDLIKDKATYQRNIKYHTADSILFKRIIGITKKNFDTTTISIVFSIRSLNLSCGNYEGFKTSGKISYIKNKELKKKILSYYENDIPNLKFGQSYYIQESSKFMNTMFDNTSNKDNHTNIEKYLCSSQVKSMANTCLVISSSISDEIKDSIKTLDDILKEIEKETKEE